MTHRPASWPGWVHAVLVYLALRAVSTCLTVLVAETQVASLWTTDSPGYLDFVWIWDGRWYAAIAEDGYRTPLPTDASGAPVQSEWAFFPAFPFLARGVMEITGLEFRQVASWISLGAGTVAAVFAYRLFRLKVERTTALGGVAVLAAWPPSPVLQYAYSESVCLLGLAGALYFLAQRSYAYAIPCAALVGLSRPIGLALVGAVLWVLVARVWEGRRAVQSGESPARDVPIGEVPAGNALARVPSSWQLPKREWKLPRREVIGLTAVALTALAASLAMIVAAAVAGGRLDAYTAVQEAWRWQPSMEYFTPWLSFARLKAGPLLGPLLVAALVAALLAVFRSRRVRGLGPEMYGWTVMYVLYLAAVTDPLGQVFRLTLPMFPLFLAMAAALHERRLLRGWLMVSLGLQLWWIATLWRFTPPSDYAP